jgi:hypothetical protein
VILHAQIEHVVGRYESVAGELAVARGLVLDLRRCS